MNDRPAHSQQNDTWPRRTWAFYSISLGVGLIALSSHSLFFAFLAFYAKFVLRQNMWEAFGALAMLAGFYLPLVVNLGFLLPLITSLIASTIAFWNPQPLDWRYAWQGPVLVLAGAINFVTYVLFASSSLFETVLTKENALILSLLLAALAGPTIACLFLRVIVPRKRIRPDNRTQT